MITTEDDFDYGAYAKGPPRIVGFDEQEREVRRLILALKAKLDKEGIATLHDLLKKWGPFYLNSLR